MHLKKVQRAFARGKLGGGENWGDEVEEVWGASGKGLGVVGEGVVEEGQELVLCS